VIYVNFLSFFTICRSELLPPSAASQIVRASALARFIRGGVLAYVYLQTVRRDRAARCLALSLLRNVTSSVGLATSFFVVLGLAALLLLMVLLFIAGLADL
jgi:hypothetical protein